MLIKQLLVKIFLRALFLICICSQQVLLADNGEMGSNYHYHEQQVDQLNIHAYIDEPLFISLGSWCDVAINLRDTGMRKAAFPFDWVASVDCEKFLEILSTDFQYFLDDEYLFVRDFHVFNNYYNLEFPHDFIFSLEELSEVLKEPKDKLKASKNEHTWETFKDKYMRRINRFRDLANYRGRVYFIRSAFGYSNHPDRYFKCSENISISDVYARKLFHVLKEYFPQLDFGVIICDIGQEPKKISENLIRVQFVPDANAINQLFKEQD